VNYLVSDGDLRSAGEQLCGLTGTIQGPVRDTFASQRRLSSQKMLSDFGGAART
jgi:hypothetical protein